ncbi:MAG: hypothetical protein IJ970_02210, partial [Mycoplasmataceae bacterium]|nr:hypothetical protein [Mycoplasmataceae bacterium]
DANKFNNILDETKKRFFEDETTSLKNIVDQTKLKNFQDTKPDDVAAFNKAVFELNNVYYGTMSSSNQGYFNDVLDEINEWTK